MPVSQALVISLFSGMVRFMILNTKISGRAKRIVRELARKHMVSMAVIVKTLVKRNLAEESLKDHEVEPEEPLFLRMPDRMFEEIKKQAKLNRKSMARYVEEIILKHGD